MCGDGGGAARFAFGGEVSADRDGLAASTAMVPGPRPNESIGALIVAFMIGSAAGNAVPVPAGLGATEAALTGVLVAAAVPAAHAIEIVLLFRLITFWAPAAVGILTAAALRRRGAI